MCNIKTGAASWSCMFSAKPRWPVLQLDIRRWAISIEGMNILRKAWFVRQPVFVCLVGIHLLCVCWFPLTGLMASEPHARVVVQTNPNVELQRLILGGANTAELLAFAEQLYLAGRLWELRCPSLPWSTWSVPGWRWEATLPNGVRIVLASDGIVLVAIRERGMIEFSALDLTRIKSAHQCKGFKGPTVHLTAANSRDFGLRAANLFRIYYYFAGPTREIVSSHLLPHPPITAY